MLASLSHFLPQALQQQPLPEIDPAATSASEDDHAQPSAHGHPPSISEEGSGERATKATGSGRRRKERKPQTMHETFIIVRPPPSKSNHPLNLQVQLVPPNHVKENSRTAETNQSTDTVNDTSGPAGPSLTLQRTPSNRSNRSSTSFYSTPSLASVTSLASSNASSTASKRRIIPLYNLSAHNVITNTVTDAGTDAKVAKFLKKGIEVIGLGVLEGYEIRSVPYDPSAAASTLPRVSVHLADEYHGGARRSMETTSTHDHRPASPSKSSTNGHVGPLTTPSSSVTHISSDNMPTPTPSTPVAEPNKPSAPSTPTANSAKKLFGKLFRKKEGSSPGILSPSNSSSLSPTPSAPSPSIFRTPKNRNSIVFGRPTENINSPTQATFMPETPTTPIPDTASTLTPTPVPCAQVLGTQPTSITRYIPTATVLSGEYAIHPKGLSAGDVGNGSHLQHLFASTADGSFRPTHQTYEWVIRRWIKGNGEGWLGNALMSATSNVFPSSTTSTSFPGGSECSAIEVKFEWSRGRSSRVRERERKEREQRRKATATESSAGTDFNGSSVRGSRPVSMNLPIDYRHHLAEKGSKSSLNGKPGGGSRPTSLLPPSKNPGISPPVVPSRQASTSTNGHSRSFSPDAHPVRPSMDSISRRSSSQSGGTTSNTQEPHHRRDGSSALKKKRAGEYDDAGDESDPEDSETPWICNLWVGPAGAVLAHQQQRQDTPLAAAKVIKLKLATLTPAPHHPKVVSQLKMPYPLPDVSITHGELRPRSDQWDGTYSDEDGLILTAEEIKDVVSVTGLWLMVREGFGGLDRKRKGDGWKIRG